MPTIVVQVGQEGNAVGQEFWHLAHSDLTACREYSSEGPQLRVADKAGLFGFSSLFREDKSYARARCIAIGSGAESLQGLPDGLHGEIWQPENLISDKNPEVDSWPQGYNQKNGSLEMAIAGIPIEAELPLLRRTLNAVRKELEATDWPAEVVVLHSLTAGTGSGCGSRILEALREAHGALYLLSAAAAPDATDESPESAYNTVLAAQWAQSYADAAVIIPDCPQLEPLRPNREGDEIAEAPSPQIEVGDSLHSRAARCLAGMLFPLQGATVGSRAALSPVQDLVTAICPDPRMKFLELRSSPLGLLDGTEAPSWTAVVNSFAPLIPRFDALDRGRPITASAAMAYLRGPFNAADIPLAQEHVEGLLKGSYSPVAWNPSPFHVRASPSQQPPERGSALSSLFSQNSVTVVANSSSIVGQLSWAATQARKSLAQGAQLELYQQQGCSREAIQDAVEAALDVVGCYRSGHCHGHGL